MAGRLRPGEGRAVVDGVASPLDAVCLRLDQPGLMTGDGAFETIGVWGGRPFRLADHLDRLDASLAALALPPVPRERLEEECDALLDGVTADAAMRIHVTAGASRIVTLSPLPDHAPTVVLIPQPAPWLRSRRRNPDAGAKTMSYGHHMAAKRRAQAAGGDEALLVSVPGSVILEGATSAVLFVARGVVHAPELGLGIVDSVSRRTVIEVALDHELDVMTGRWPLDALADADEVILSSSLRPATPVGRVGRWTYGRAHPVTDTLAQGLWDRRRGTT